MTGSDRVLRHRHIESLEQRLEATERRLEQLTGRFDRMESGRESVGPLSGRPSTVAYTRVPEMSIDNAEPEPINGSADATDGVGSVMFAKEERVDAGFFGTYRPGSRPLTPFIHAILTYPLQVRHQTFLLPATSSAQQCPS